MKLKIELEIELVLTQGPLLSVKIPNLLSLNS